MTTIKGADYTFTGGEYEPTGLPVQPPSPPPPEDDNPARLRPLRGDDLAANRKRIADLTGLLRPLPKVSA